MFKNTIKLKQLAGFSLVELAVVLAVMGLVFYGAMDGFGEFYKTSSVEQSKKSAVNIKKHLQDYAVINKYLPCPDTDTPPDGIENRTAVVSTVGTFQRCVDNVGSVPFSDLGLELADVKDSWGNLIRYAVNQNTTITSPATAVVMCDKNDSASYFCNEGGGRFTWFTMNDTPPFAGNPGSGNYLICNETADKDRCYTGTPLASDLVTNTAVAVLVAYNEDGANTLASCTTANAANKENCDTDDRYIRRQHTKSSGDFFDDVVIEISGYDLKREILGNMTFTGVTPGGLPAATYSGYDLDVGDYTPLNSPQHPDVIMVNRNVTTALDLGLGDDYISIGNDLQSEIIYDNTEQDTIATVDGVLQDGSLAPLDAGSGDDKVYIGNDAYSSVDLGSGNDTFVLVGALKADLYAGSDDDEVWIQGEVGAGTIIDLDDGDDVIWIGVNGDNTSGVINSDSGSIIAAKNSAHEFDVIIFENLTRPDWESDAVLQSKFVGFDLVIFKDDGTGNREYLSL